MRVLMCAYACEPGKGSEPGSGWGLARAAAQHHQVHLLTRKKNLGAIHDAMQSDPVLQQNLVVEGLDLGRAMLRAKRGPGGVQIYYALWQAKVLRRARRLQELHPFDVAHHVTFALDWLPAATAFVGIPHIWGPVGGATVTPLCLYSTLTSRSKAAEAARTVAGAIGRATGGRATAQRSSLVVANNTDVAQRFGPMARTVVEPHIALSPDLTTHRQRHRARPRVGSHRRAIVMCRLVAWKGVHLAVEALTRPEAAGWTLDIYGDGPERARLEVMVERLGLGERVALLGEVHREEALAQLVDADAFLQPTMHDSASWAVGEAVTLGCPVICLALGGPADLVHPGEGVVINPCGDVVGEIAAGLGSIEGRHRGSDRYLDTRLPGLLTSWYTEAVRTPLPRSRFGR